MTTSATERWLPLPHVHVAAAIRLLCLPHAGGRAHAFATWRNAFSANVDVCPVELPGHGTRHGERPLTSIVALASSAAVALRPERREQIALFGHSMGALLAFEIARELRDLHGVIPVHLFVAAERAPHLPPVRPVHTLSGLAFREKLRELGGTPHDVLDNDELFTELAPLLRTDFAACDTYAHVRAAPLACPITVFGGRDDPIVGRRELEAWREHTTADFDLQLMQGDHFFIRISEPQVLGAVAAALERGPVGALDRVGRPMLEHATFVEEEDGCVD